MGKRALEGIRVADFTWVLAGPQCTKFLASMGAEVIKIESRKRVDSYRTGGAMANGIRDPDNGGNFQYLGYNKRSCTIDLTNPVGQKLAAELVRVSDVVVENFSHGVMQRFGLDYERLKGIRPDIVMASLSALGRTGPDKEQVAFGSTLHGFSGLNGLVGYPGGPPRGIGSTYVDPLAALTMAMAIMAALYHRRRSREGQYIDISMVEAVLSQMPEALMDYSMNGRSRGPMGNADDVATPHNCYRTTGNDKWIAISCYSDEQWQSLASVLGHPEWKSDPRFCDAFARRKHQGELDRLVAEYTRDREGFELMEQLQCCGVPAGVSLNTRALVHNPHLQARQFLVEIDHPRSGKRLVPGLPWKIHPEKVSYAPAPLMGQHNHYVFSELLGMDQREIESLEQAGVIS